jgi:hypothetical protein
MSPNLPLSYHNVMQYAASLNRPPVVQPQTEPESSDHPSPEPASH